MSLVKVYSNQCLWLKYTLTKDSLAKIQAKMQIAKRAQEASCKAMLEKSCKRLKPTEVGNTVMIPLLPQDRGKLDRKNVHGLVISNL